VTAPTANGFSLAAAPGGPAIATSGTQSGTHTALVPSTSPDVQDSGGVPTWLDIGPTNAAAMFDAKWGTQSLATNSITVQLAPGEVIDSIALLNLLGKQVTVTCTLGSKTIFTRVISLQTDIGVYDWRTWWLAPIVTQDDVFVTDLLPYSQQVITVKVEGPSAVAIGNIGLGTNIDLGGLEAGARVGITSYSKRERDDQGNVSIVERPYNKWFSGRLVVATSFVDQLTAIFAQIRDRPVIWVGAGSLFSSLIIWGFFRDFEVELAYPEISYCTISIEGLV
jgi:hypothetical protein